MLYYRDESSKINNPQFYLKKLQNKSTVNKM